MSYQKYIGLFFLLIAATTVDAQKAERDLIRKGNRMYNDSVYENAEVNYRKALEINPKSTVAMYNLANTLMQQNKLQEAMEQFASAAKVEKEKPNLAQIYHNMGVIFQSQKDYAKAIEATKGSYAPYSNFHVGAALMLDSGEILTGANQENIAYPSGLCAERVALFGAHANRPERLVEAIAIVAESGGSITERYAFPCGACRQVMIESQQRAGKSIKVLIGSRSKILMVDSVTDLLPFVFDGLEA